ncbi:MAG: hypothetical protein JNL69_04745 [Bacteroidia bacterium]|nr:hypothetical protein [Bacteroidia bacterium]
MNGIGLLFGTFRKGENIDSSWGMPLWSYILTLVIIAYVIIRVWMELRKDKKK